MNKTAMQELIEFLKQERGESIIPMVKLMFAKVELKATELLELERKQIEEAYSAGWEMDKSNSENYFTTTYPPSK